MTIRERKPEKCPVYGRAITKGGGCKIKKVV